MEANAKFQLAIGENIDLIFPHLSLSTSVNYIYGSFWDPWAQINKL